MVLPFTLSVMRDADAFEIAQPDPWKLASMDPIAFDAQVHGQAIAAQRVVAFGMPPLLDRAEIARPSIVIEDDLLIELLKAAAHTNTSRTFASAAASASISSRVL